MNRHGQAMGGAILPEMMRWLWRDHPVSTDPRDTTERIDAVAGREEVDAGATRRRSRSRAPSCSTPRSTATSIRCWRWRCCSASKAAGRSAWRRSAPASSICRSPDSSTSSRASTRGDRPGGGVSQRLATDRHVDRGRPGRHRVVDGRCRAREGRTPKESRRMSRTLPGVNDTADAVALIRNALSAQADRSAAVVLAGRPTNLVALTMLCRRTDVGGPEGRDARDCRGALRQGHTGSGRARRRRRLPEAPRRLAGAHRHGGHRAERGAAVSGSAASTRASRGRHSIPSWMRIARSGRCRTTRRRGRWRRCFMSRTRVSATSTSREPGTITVTDDGPTRFTPSPAGTHLLSDRQGLIRRSGCSRRTCSWSAPSRRRARAVAVRPPAPAAALTLIGGSAGRGHGREHVRTGDRPGGRLQRRGATGAHRDVRPVSQQQACLGRLERRGDRVSGVGRSRA